MYDKHIRYFNDLNFILLAQINRRKLLQWFCFNASTIQVNG